MRYVPDVVVLAGGFGTRLAGAIADRPKVIAPVAGRPFLDWLIEDLHSAGARRVILATGYLGDQIEAHYRSRSMPGLRIEFSPEREPLGTGGAIRHALPLVHGSRVFVTNGDTFAAPSLDRMLAFHSRNAARATLWTVDVDDCRRYGSVEVDATGAVRAFREKTADLGPGTINAGTILLDCDVARDIPSNRHVSLEREVLPFLIGRGLYALAGTGPFIDIGTPDSFELAQTFFPVSK